MFGLTHVTSVFVNAKNKNCIQCSSQTLTESEIELILFRGLAKKPRRGGSIYARAHYCKQCDAWTMTEESFQQLEALVKKPLRLLRRQVKEVVDTSKIHFSSKTAPGFDRYGRFKPGEGYN